jgi:hypothetical protein
MKDKHKYLIKICNSIKAPVDDDGDIDLMWWTTLTGDGWETNKSIFVKEILESDVFKNDKDFSRREFLKQVRCTVRDTTLIDSVFSKEASKLHKKLEKEREKHEKEYREWVNRRVA